MLLNIKFIKYFYFVNLLYILKKNIKSKEYKEVYNKYILRFFFINIFKKVSIFLHMTFNCGKI